MMYPGQVRSVCIRMALPRSDHPWCFFVLLLKQRDVPLTLQLYTQQRPSTNGRARTFNDVVLAICTALGRPLRIRYIDMPVALRCQYQNFTQADLGRNFAGAFITLEPL